jgi:alanyl-tRNA synthetase
MTSSEIRRQFIEFFVQKHGHTFVPSSPVVPHDDPTLLFTNAGMNQFKPIFLGTEKRAYTRAVNTQKCIRAGGKHNDLDDVGRSRRHHTFFEMLGNWSFGDYFKKEAIAWSWELLTKVWGLDPTRLHVTVHAGDAAIGVERDDEAANIWRQVANWEQYGLKSDDHIHYGNTKDNFWEMGETGPCGPCTEIFVDRTPDKTGGKTVLSGEDPRVMEIWNNVFIQYNRNPDRSLTPLPAKHVDTGMGLERIIQVLQKKDDNYAIDLFDPFWAKLKELSGFTYTGKYPKTNSADPVAEAADAQLRHDIAFRVIADHIRCLTFALTDGATVSNEGRGYVLRRILRRAVRFGRQQLELKDPFLHKLVPVVVEAMGDAFPELKSNPSRVAEIIKDEEVSFGRTLDRGIQLFDDAAARAAGKIVSGEDAFKLHDTYGFPIDLTRIMAEERGMSVDLAGYEKLMEEAREKARSGGKEGDTALFDLPPDVIAKLQSQGVSPTEDSAKYAGGKARVKVKGIWNGKELVEHAASPSPGTPGEGRGEGSTKSGDTNRPNPLPEYRERGQEHVSVVLDRTPFYAEMGGQVGDEGTLVAPGTELAVTTTRVVGGYVLHVAELRHGSIKVGTELEASVDAVLRPRTEQNHTTTHIANWALREVLGDGVQQKGSLVDPEKLRFDFSHGKALSDDELARIEQLANEYIGRKAAVYAEEAPQEQALKINGLRAVFGEKYPPRVRVVSIGAPVADLLADPGNAKWRNYSIEFCGGTHLKSSEQAGSFVITAEESVSKGIRRIVAHTGDAAKRVQAANDALDALVAKGAKTPDNELSALVQEIQKSLAASPIGLRAKRKAQQAITDLQTRIKAYEKAQKQSAATSVDVAGIAEKLLSAATVSVAAAKVVVGEVPDATAEQLGAVADSLRKRAGASYAILIGSKADGKVSFVSMASDDVIAKGLKAGDWIREAAKTAGGGGGGRPNHAQAGGKDPAKLGEALEVARAFASKFA